jgi:hypothetical protein
MNRADALTLLLGIGLALTISSLFLYLFSYISRCLDPNRCSPYGETVFLYPLPFGVLLVVFGVFLVNRELHSGTNHLQSVNREKSA